MQPLITAVFSLTFCYNTCANICKHKPLTVFSLHVQKRCFINPYLKLFTTPLYSWQCFITRYNNILATQSSDNAIHHIGSSLRNQDFLIRLTVNTVTITLTATQTKLTLAMLHKNDFIHRSLKKHATNLFTPKA
jgi:hypothetical protein